MHRLTRALAILSVAIAALVGVQVSQAPPAEAAITTFGCNPSSTGWNLEGAWDDGSVMESRTCLQWDSSANLRRVKTEWRARRGGTALSGTDWDLDANDDGRPFWRSIYIYNTGVDLGVQATDNDVFNASLVTRYSSWSNLGACPGNYAGMAYDIRATPPGLPRSGYKSNPSNLANLCN